MSITSMVVTLLYFTLSQKASREISLRKFLDEWKEKYEKVQADVARAKLGTGRARSRRNEADEQDKDDDDAERTRPAQGSREGQFCSEGDANEGNR